MKLNNRGWGIREMLFFIAILVFFFCLAIYFIYVFYSSVSIKDYMAPEKNICIYEDRN